MYWMPAVSHANDEPDSLIASLGFWIRKLIPMERAAFKDEAEGHLPDLPTHILVDIGLRKVSSLESCEVWERDGYRYVLNRQSHAPDPIRA